MASSGIRHYGGDVDPITNWAVRGSGQFRQRGRDVDEAHVSFVCERQQSGRVDG